MVIPSYRPRPPLAAFLLLLLPLAAVSPSSSQQAESIEFVQYDPSPSLLEEQPAGTLLTRFVVFYLDQNGAMRTDGTFSLSSATGDHTLFTLDSSSGELRSAVMFDRDANGTQELFRLDITYTTPAGTSDSRSVISIILDINDNTPSFIQDVFNVSVYEAVAAGSVFAAVTATDPDVVVRQQQVDYVNEVVTGFLYIVENGRIIYEIVDGNDLGHFTLDPDSGDIGVSEGTKLDYDVIRYYNFTVRARDGDNQTDYATVSIHVLDSNDNRPIITGPFGVSVTIPEDTPPGFIIVDHINSTDADHDTNADIKFSIIDGDPNNVFSIDEATGRITTSGALDREFASSITLVAAAIDQGDPPLTGTVEVLVTLLDINDFPPQFDQDSYSATVSEAARVGTRVVLISAADPDLNENGTVSYFLLDPAQPFSIDPSSGQVVTTARMDRETVDEFVVTIGAVDNSTVEELRLTSFVNVTVTVSDINDNFPYFDRPYFTANLLDSASVGEEAIQLYAFDDDFGSNAQIRWQVISGDTGTFQFDLSSGRVTVGAELRFETLFQFNYSLYAWDMGPIPNSNQTQLFITVHNENENPPVFDPSTYNVTLYESAAVGSVVLNVSAEDPDPSFIGEVRYRVITEFDAAGGFGVDPVTGEVFIAADLDFDTRSSIEFQIEAYDGGFPDPFTDIANISVELLDVNDNPPSFTFDPQSFTFNVSENRPAGEFIVNIIDYIVDPDTGSGGVYNFTISQGGFEELPPKNVSEDDPVIILGAEFNETLCNLTALNTSAMFNGSFNETLINETFCNVTNLNASMEDVGPIYLVHFELDETTGVLTSGRRFDRETEPFISLQIMMWDFGSPPLTSFTNVTIRVLDQNDNDPYFASNFSGSIIEYNEIGEQFLTVTAFDDDIGENSRLTYSIYSGNELQRFAIHPDNGSIYAAARLNKTDVNRYVLGIMAIDNGDPKRYTHQIAYAEVEVLDFNDNPPVFPSEFIYTSVPENSNISTAFHQVQASDEDIGSNSELTYFFLDSEESSRFVLYPVSGLLATNDTFDAENETEILLTVVAVDMGRIPLTSTAIIVVRIEDMNDLEPYFVDDSYNATVIENSLLGTHVTTVQAVDDDREERNSAIRYSLSGDRSEPFTIDEISGVITVDGEVDWELGPVFCITITASDTGMPFLSANATLTVSIVDVNDNPPVFDPASLSLGVVEDLPMGTEVGQVVVDDADSQGNNSAVTFTIAMDFSQGRFLLDPDTGIVTTTTPLNREQRDKYDILVRAMDHGLPPLYSEANVTITVLDANDHRPQFIQDLFEGSIPENSPRGTPILTVEATDRDTGSNGDILYSLASDAASHFAINATSGVLYTTNIELDFESFLMPFTFTVVAEDQGSPALNATATVRVTVTDVNDEPPVFSQGVYSGEVWENYAIGTVILQVNATDVDTGNGGVIRFGLEAGAGSEYFGIDGETGVLHTVLHVDHEVTPNVTLTVTATNPLAPINQVSTATIEITVLDMNDNHPTFNQSAYVILLPESTTQGEPFAMVTAVDGDLEENGTISYSFISGNDWNIFHIDSATGQLSLLQEVDFEAPPNTYTLGLMAMDHSIDRLSNYTTLYIRVVDVNDNQPFFATNSSTVSISFGTPVGDEVVVLEVHDADTPSVNQLTFSIASGNDAHLFNITDSTVGRIETAQSLTAHAGTSVMLVVMVSDGMKEVFHQLTIEVIQTSSTLPVFNTQNYMGTVSEDASMDHSILDVFAINANDYIIVSGNDEDIFKIDSFGTLMLAQPVLDFENRRVYQVTVAGVNGGEMGYTLVTILVTDVNDIPPLFPHASYFVAVSESVGRGSPILQLSAMDQDGTIINSQTVYSITMTTPPGNTFRIDSSSGELRLNRRLDYELGDRNFTIVVEAANQIDPANFKNSTTVQVLVLEDNDNFPTFDTPSYVFTLVEGSMVGMVIIDLNASDSDSGSNSRISFGLTGNHHYTDFVIHPHSGIVTIGAELDRERESSYILEVHGTDTGRSPQEGIVGVTINILDLNDNSPIWESEQYHRTVFENISLNTVLLTVRASDADQIDVSNGTEIVYHVTNGLVTYNITHGDPLQQFSIHNMTGVVTVTKPLDRESTPSYNLTLTATDGGGRYANAYLTVVLLDLNDSPPKFTMDTYTTGLSEHAPLGEEFFTILATDPDNVGLNSNFTYAIQSGNEGGEFTLNDTTGVLSTAGLLDREAIPLYNLTVIAVDFGSPPRTGTAAVLVNVLDENDSTPMFDAPSYLALVPENTTIGSVILQVTAQDNDTGPNGAILYRLFAIATVAIDNNATNESRREATELVQSSTFLIADSSIGDISLLDTVDYETQTEYELILFAYDSALASLRRSSSVELRVVIEDINDNIPVFAQSSYSAAVKENSPLDSLVLTVNATDGDAFDRISYSIVSTIPEPNPFRILGNGTIISSGQLDREVYDHYVLRVRAADTASPPHDAFVTVTITVTDRNEHAPQFSQPVYVTAVFENQPANGLFTSVPATDADLGPNAEVLYLLENTISDLATCLATCSNMSLCSRVFPTSASFRNDSSVESLSLFAINQYNGDILSNSSYDREASDWYTLVVMVTDQGIPPDDPPLSSSVCVFVEIVDLNDNPPLFLSDVYEVNAEENRVPVNPILLLSVADDDIGTNTDTEFSIVSYTEGGGAFRLLPQGDLELVGALDREATPFINLTVMAANIEAPYLSSTAVVVVTVDDVNDNPPFFDTDSYQTSISENLPAGSYVVTVSATDVDVGVNSEIMYSIASTSEGAKDLFTIDPHSGNVSTVAVLDRELNMRHTLLITATDGGSRPLNTNVTLVINVTDTNDLPPVFSEPSYSAAVLENEHMVQVATVLATDGDIESNAVVFYFIASVSPFSEAFSIDNSTGVIVLIQPLDAEEYTTYEVIVMADNGPATPYLGNNVTVTVAVEDKNDNRPLFQSDSQQAVVSERAAIGSEVLTVKAKDADVLPVNSQVVYFIEESGFPGNSSSGALPFFIHSDNGTLVVAAQLDFENITLYEFDVVAMDTGNLPQSSSSHVLISVQDSNDNFPLFSQPTYQFFIVENSLSSSFIGRVTASDVDMGQLVYHIVEYGDDSNSFQIDSQSGELFGNETFDREEQLGYAFNVTVVDYGPDSLVKSATVEVFVEVLDLNDNTPEFDSKMYGQFAPENISLGSEVIFVSAFDPDFGLNGTITYRLVDSADASHFEINSTSGEIRTRTLLDRERQSEFSFLVEATDGGIFSRAATADVLIVLTDINDNCPSFRQSIYSTIINENIDVATPIIYLGATDADIDENADVRFAIEGDHYDHFSVNPQTGVISTSADIDYEVLPFYNFTALVTDLGTPSLSSSVTVTVQVVDLNDNMPVFDMSVYNVTIPENNVLGSIVFRIPATDEDSTSNGELRYTITRGNAGSHFAVNEVTGYITTAAYLDREQVPFYEMGLQVVDQGSPQYTATATLQLHVSDENDNRPQFEMRIYEFPLSELLSGESATVSSVSASDADSGSNEQLRYSIIDGSSDGRFSIDEIDGRITAVGPLSFTQVKSVTLSIEARDGGSPSLYDTAIVIIQVDDVNTFPPVTSVTSYEVDITNNAVPGTAILYLGASDDDRNSVTGVTYTLTSGDSTLFAVDMLTGAVTVAGSLTMATGTHSVTVSLSDGTQAHEVVVQIAVNTISTSKPIFEPFAVEVQVPEPTVGSSEITLVQLSTLTSANSVNWQLPSSQSASTVYSNPSNAAGLAELSSAFRVDGDGSLILTDTSYLDRERRDAVIVPVEAINSVNGEAAYGTVTIRIVDQNDSPPVFSSNVYHVAVSEATNADVMLVLLRVNAYDLDQAGDDSAILYSITNGNDNGHFGVDSNSGEVMLVLPLDREASPSHYITVRATNHLSSLQLSSEAYISVTVLDDNDNTPAFGQPNYHIELLDTTPIGTEIFYSGVHDPDEGLNSELVFSFTYESHPGVFELNVSSGVISTAQRVLPQPTTPGYEVTLDVADRGFPVPHHQSVCVFVDVYPVNTLPPVFNQDVYLSSIPETSAPGSDVTTVIAPDGDTNTTQGVSYVFLSGNDRGDFFISSESGEVTTAKELDFLRQNFYSLVVMATDNGRPVTMTTTATINISVVDINDHVPQFGQLSYSTVVMENVTMGMTILRVQATDVDAESIIYIISRNSIDLVTGLNLFVINSTTGEITINAPLDFEQAHSHQLTVSAVDTGYPTQRSNNVPVSITVTDLNDVTPMFSANQYPDAEVYRRQQMGTFVTMVTATDSDTVGGPVMYSLQSGDTDSLFSINSTTGEITLSREIPEVTSSTEYVLVVRASDGMLSSTAAVRVVVLATGTYCEGDFCTEIVDRHRERCPDGLSPSPSQSPSFTVGGELCIRYYCTSSNTYPCLSARACIANGYSCEGGCPSGESVCPTTDLCHSVALVTTCDGSNVTCLAGQVLVQDPDGTRKCALPLSLPSTALSCTQPNMIYCSELDQCSLLTAPHLCRHCPFHLFYCPTTDSCLPSEQQCCSAMEYYCNILASCLPNGGRCEFPNVAPRVEQSLFLAEVVMSFEEDSIYSSDGYVIGLLLSLDNETATDSQGEELGVAITEVQDVSLSLGEWQFATCKDSVGDTFGTCRYLTSPWQLLPSRIDQSNAFLLPPDSRLRFVRKTLELEGAIWLRVKLWDGNKDGYLSPEHNLTRSEIPHFESTLPFTANGAFSEETSLVALLLYPETTQPEFQDVGVAAQLSAINEEEIPLYNKGNVLRDAIGSVQLTDLPVVNDFIIGGFPSVPPQLNVSHYQALLPSNIINGYFEAVAKANPPRKAREYARAMNQSPGVALSFGPPTDSTIGRWQVSGSGSSFDWTYLDDIIDDNSLVLLNLSALVRFAPSKDFHGKVSIQLQPWDGFWNDTIATVTPGNYIVTSSLSNQSPSLNSVVRAELEVLSVEEAPIILKRSLELDPLPYSILYNYARLFTLQIEQPVGVLRQDQGTIAQLLQVALGHAVNLKRFVPTNATSSLMSFSVASNALTFNEVVSKVTSNRGTLDNLIGPVLDIRRDAFYSPGAGCYSNLPPAEPIHGTQVQQVMDAVAIDDDSNVLGMAVIGSSNGDSSDIGIWQYYRANYSDSSIVLQNGVNTYQPEHLPWVNFPRSLSEPSALLLRPQDRVRFVPSPSYFWSNESKPHIIVKAWDLSLWQPEQENGHPIEQSFHSIDTDPYSSAARSLASPVGRFSTATVLVSVSRLGCDDITNSRMVHNPCCVCGRNGNGNGTPCEDGCVADVVMSPAQSYDSCDVCGGRDESCLGCDFVPFSESTPIECTVCLSEVSISTSNLGSVQFWNMSHLVDCTGTCFGTAILDECDVCSDGTSEHDFNSDMDCSGSCFGEAVTDDCGYCTGGSTGLQFNQFRDCSGTCDGPFVEDCGVCHNPTSPAGSTSYRDCTGVCFGAALVDVCGVCYGGSSIVQAANSTLDACGVCEGDNSSCVGCDNVTASGKMTDSCGHCDGNDCGCMQITSATPRVGPVTGGTMIRITGAGFFINDSTLFNSSLPNCGTPTLLPDRSPIPADCFFRSLENQQQFQGAAYIVNHFTIICLASDTSSFSETLQEFEILVRVNGGTVLAASPPIIFQASDYSNVNVISITPVDTTLDTSPTVTFTGVNFINSSDIRCLVDFAGCSPTSSDDVIAVGKFLSSTKISCQLPPSYVQCMASIQLSLNGQSVGIVPQKPLPEKVFNFTYGGPPPVVLSVHFSSDLHQLMVTFDTSVELVNGRQLSCAAVFAPETLVAFGNEQARCKWNSVDQREIAITLPSVATVTDETEVVFLDDVIISQAPEEIPIDERQNYRRIPIRGLSIPVNGSVNRVIPVALIEGQPNIPSCPATVRFRGDKSLYPGYREFVYMWSIHIQDSSIQGYPGLVEYLSNLPPDTSTISFSSELLQASMEYYLQLVVRNTQGHFSEPDWLLLTRSSQWDSLIEVQIQGLSNRTVAITDSIFLLSQIFIPDCLEIQNRFEYQWSAYKVADAVRGTLSEVPLVGVKLNLPTIFVPSIFLEPLETYIFVLQVGVTGGDITGSDNVTIAVEPRGPIARIFGGDYRSVLNNGTIVLDATPSLVHPALGNSMFTWTCSEEVSKQPCYNVSGGVIRINLNNATITIPAETLNPGSYRFNVIITQEERQSSATAVVSVEEETSGSKLLVGISPIDVATAASTMVLEGWVYTDVSNVIAAWSLLAEPGYGFLDEADSHKLSPPSLSVEPFYINRVNFAIGPRVLEPGVRYLFELKAVGGGVSGFARVEVRVDTPPLLQEVRVDPPTGESLSTVFMISTTGENVDSENLPLVYRYGIQNGSATFWLSGEIPSPSIQAILPSLHPSQNTSLQIVVQVRDNGGNQANFLSDIIELQPPNITAAEALDQIQMQYTQNGNWIEALASLGSYLYGHSVMGIPLADDVATVVTEMLFSVSALSPVDMPTHHQLIAQYLSALTLSTESLSEPRAEKIAQLISETLMENTFETASAPRPVPEGMSVDDLNSGSFSGAQMSLPTEEVSQNLAAVQRLMGTFPTSSYLRELYPELLDVVSSGICSLLTVGGDDVFLVSPNTQLAVRKVSPSQLGGLFKPCPPGATCSSADVGQSFGPALRQQVCDGTEGRTLPLCEEACLQSNQQIQDSGDEFELADFAKNEILMNSGADPETVRPFSAVSSFSVPILSANGNEYALLSKLDTPITVYLPVMGTFQTNVSQLLCLYRQRGGGGSYSNEKWLLDSTDSPNMEEMDGVQTARCQYNHLTEFILGLLPIPIIPSSSIIMSSTSSPSTSMATTSPTPTVVPPPPGGAAINPAAIGVPVVLILLIAAIVTLALFLLFFMWRKWKKRAKVSIMDEPGPSGEVAEEEVKTEDHRVSKSVIALLDEGKRELFGNVLVLPNARLRAVREVVAGTFEEKLQNKPFYLLTTDFADFEPAVEPFKYLNIVYPDTIFIRLVFTQTETTLRHFCPCGKASAFECSQCTSRGYCGTDCQLEDWEREHGKECKRLAEKRRRTEVLGRRAAVPALGSSTAEQQAGLATPTSSMGRTLSRGSVQDWKGLLMSQRQASTFRPLGALTPIEEHPRLSQPPPSSEDTDAQTHVDRETLIMKPPPKMADPFAVPSKPPSAPLGARRLPPVRPSHIAVSPPGTALSLLEPPMKPHDAQSYYWNRFKAVTRKDAAQLPHIKPAPAPREFVPPQPLEASPAGFTPMGTTPGAAGVSPRLVGASPHPVGVLPRTTAQQTPVFTRPPMVFSRHPLPPSRGLSIHSVTSEDFDSSLNASKLRQSLRGEAVLEEGQLTSSDSDSSTESSSEEEESG